MKTKTLRLPLRVVFYKEEDHWVAHCLEFDLIGTGVTRRNAIASLSDAIHIQVSESLEHGNVHNLFSPADGRFLEMFAAGRDVVEGELQLKLEPIDSLVIERTESREYSEGDLVPC